MSLAIEMLSRRVCNDAIHNESDFTRTYQTGYLYGMEAALRNANRDEIRKEKAIVAEQIGRLEDHFVPKDKEGRR